MTAVRKAKRRRPAEPPRESQVYDGSRMLGEIRPKSGGFIARTVSGRRLGSFATEKSAMKAICAGAHAERAASANP
jgi:hypothetical protein